MIKNDDPKSPENPQRDPILDGTWGFMLRNIRGWKVLLAVLLVVLLIASGSAIACLDGKQGDVTYDLVAVRQASDVASTLPNAPPGDLLERRITIGRTLVWHDGTVCEDWTYTDVSNAPHPIDDPILSDVAIGPIEQGDQEADRRIWKGREFKCNGELVGTLTWVDERLLIASTDNGSMYLIFEVPLASDAVRQVQDALRHKDFYMDDANGEMDEVTKAALAAYSESRGAAYRFANPVASENLLDGLEVLWRTD